MNSGELFTKVLKEQNNMVCVCCGGNPEISNIRKLLPREGLEGQKRCHLIPGARVPTIKQDSEEGGMPRLGSWRTRVRDGDQHAEASQEMLLEGKGMNRIGQREKLG